MHIADFFSAGPVTVSTLLGMYMWAGRTCTNSIQTEQIFYMGLSNIFVRGLLLGGMFYKNIFNIAALMDTLHIASFTSNLMFCCFTGNLPTLLFYKQLKLCCFYGNLVKKKFYEHLAILLFTGT